MGMGMIHSSWRRRAVTTVVAGASAIALAAPSVSAAPAAGPDRFAGQAEATALKLTLLGQAIQQGTINQIISRTLVQLDSSGKAVAKSDLLSGLLDKSLDSTQSGARSGKDSILSLKEGPVKIGAGEMEYVADPVNRVTRSFSQLADLEVGLQGLDAADVEGLVEKATETLETGITTDLSEIVEQVETVTGKELVKTPSELEDIASNLSTRTVPTATEVTDLLDVEKLWSESISETVNDTITATSKAGVVNLNLLGGPAEIPRFEFRSLARTNGKPGGAVADTKIDRLDINDLAGKQLISLDNGVLTIPGLPPIDLNDPRLAGLQDDVNGLVETLLNAIGLSIVNSEAKEFAAPDGSRARAETSALAIGLHPLNAAGANNALGLNLSLLPTLAEVTAANVAPGAQPKAPAAVGRQPGPSLPRTGAGSVAVLLGGLALGGAFALRRFTKS